VTDRPRALVILIAVFLLGGIIGATGSYIWLKKSMSSPAPMMGNIPQARSQGRPRMPEFLKLTPEQETQFREIMAESRRKLGELQKEQAPKVEAVRTETNQRFSEILNEEQRKKFEAFQKEMQNRRERAPRVRESGPPPESNRKLSGTMEEQRKKFEAFQREMQNRREPATPGSKPEPPPPQ
jgi:uncharacterized membrane protein